MSKVFVPQSQNTGMAIGPSSPEQLPLAIPEVGDTMFIAINHWGGGIVDPEALKHHVADGGMVAEVEVKSVKKVTVTTTLE